MQKNIARRFGFDTGLAALWSFLAVCTRKWDTPFYRVRIKPKGMSELSQVFSEESAHTVERAYVIRKTGSVFLQVCHFRCFVQVKMAESQKLSGSQEKLPPSQSFFQPTCLRISSQLIGWSKHFSCQDDCRNWLLRRVMRALLMTLQTAWVHSFRRQHLDHFLRVNVSYSATDMHNLKFKIINQHCARLKLLTRGHLNNWELGRTCNHGQIQQKSSTYKHVSLPVL